VRIDGQPCPCTNGRCNLASTGAILLHHPTSHRPATVSSGTKKYQAYECQYGKEESPTSSKSAFPSAKSPE